MKILNNITEAIGGTPLIKLSKFKAEHGLFCDILAKAEFFNPAGSVKDRIAKAMLEKAEEKGLLTKDSVIIEPTSGNTGIGLAMVAASKGYRVIFTMPETMSMERRMLLSAYGAEIVLTDGGKGMAGAIEKAEELAKKGKNAFIPGQFENPENPAAHYNTTGPEIYKDAGGNLDFFIAGVGTGGTLSGTGKYLKEKNPSIKIIAVEPASSAVLSGEEAGAHPLQGIGAGFIPKTLDVDIIDEIIKATGEDAEKMCRSLAKCEGILTGISAGAALYAATVIGKRRENEGKKIAVLLPDTGDRYLSAGLFS